MKTWVKSFAREGLFTDTRRIYDFDIWIMVDFASFFTDFYEKQRDTLFHSSPQTSYTTIWPYAFFVM